jgi:hypothetical protein
MTDYKPKTGPGNIKRFDITSNKGGKTVDLAGGVAEYFYYESVLSNYITATAIVMESGNTIDGATKATLDDLPIRGGEKTDILVSDSQADFTIQVPGGLYVKDVRNASPGTQTEIYVIDFASKEYFLNETARVTKRYEGKISDNAEEILRDVLKTTSKVEVDETSFEYNFYGNTRKPFYVVTTLASKAVPTQGTEKTGGFLFFQTRDGLYFKSIDDLFKKESTKKFIYNNTADEVEGYDGKIVAYKISSDIDMEQNLSFGAYNNRSLYFDFFKMEYKKVDFDIQKQKGAAENAGKDFINVNEEFIEKPSRLLHALLDMGVNPKGTGDEQLDNFKQEQLPNFKIEETMVQTIMRYNQMFTVQTNITIPGDFSIKAGDIIECDFPELEAVQNKETNKQTGGKYMVAHVCHRITPVDCYTSLGLVRDSFGKKGGF